MTNTLKESFDNSFKVLVIALPMKNDIMDLYGVVYFIDEILWTWKYCRQKCCGDT